MQQSHVAQISPFTARFCRTSHVFVASCKRALILQEAMFTTRKGLWLNVQVASRHLVRYGQLLNIADCCYWVCFGVFLYHGQWPANAVYFFTTLTLMFFGCPVYLRSLSLTLLLSPEMRFLAAGKLIHRQRFSDTYTLSPAHSR